MESTDINNMTCPIPINDYPHVTMAHGGGGKLMQQLIDKMFVTAFSNPLLDARHDSATFEMPAGRLAFTTDSYVVQPLFFPGGDIGSLAINGTVNDLAMSGARPLYLSCGMIIEEGFPMETLWRVVQSMQAAAEAADVCIVTGDTKVVDRGKGDGIFINTAGVGVIEHDLVIHPNQVQPGDAIIVNGDLGRHGITIMATREGLEFETELRSDCAPLSDVVRQLVESTIDIHCLRDLTRGGLTSALNEISESAKVSIQVDENLVPVREDVQGACEILGFDPMYVANEGRFIAIVPESEADKTLQIMQDAGHEAVLIGQVTGDTPALVTVRSQIGATRILDMLNNEQLPRIC